MFERLRQVLVESYVGAIGLGLLFAQSVGHFATVIYIRTNNWLVTGPYRQHFPMPTGFRDQSILPELVRGLFLLIVFGLLLYWLYFPLREQREQTELPFESQPEQTE